mgnify:CR=1 FL=1
MNAITPIPPMVPSIIPENAPFSTEQRAWLNGFFAAYLGLDGPNTSAAAPGERREGRRRRNGHSGAMRHHAEVRSLTGGEADIAHLDVFEVEDRLER